MTRLLFTVLALLATETQAISWDRPLFREDGKNLLATEIQSYEIYWTPVVNGDLPELPTMVINIGAWGAHFLESLTWMPQTGCFGMKTVDTDKRRSRMSNKVCVTGPPNAPVVSCSTIQPPSDF